MKMFKLLIMILLISICYESFSQIGITSYSIYALGINTSQSRRISGELKMFANRSIEDLLIEINGFCNFKPRDYHRFSVGIGFNIGPFRGFDNIYALTIPASIEFFPFKDFKRISFLFELAPELLVEEDINIRWLWGIRYSFVK